MAKVKKQRNKMFEFASANHMPKALAKKGTIFCYLMLSFSIVHFLVFWVLVNGNSLIIAFSIRDAGGTERFSFENFTYFFQELQNPYTTARYAVINTVYYFLADMFKRVAGFVIAFFFFKKLWGYKTFRVIFFIPAILSDVIEVIVFKNFINVYGPLWEFVRAVFGYEIPALLGSPATATGTILVYVIWAGFGSTMLIFVGVMHRIPMDIIEAARIDGAKWYTEFGKICLPLSWPTLYTMLVLGISGILMASGPIMVFTGGNFNTNTLSYWLYSQVRAGSFNYPAAISLCVSAVTIPLVFFSRWIMSRWSINVEF